MPKITSSMVNTAMHLSEAAGMIFAAVLMFHLFNPKLIGSAAVALTALAFIACLVFVKFADYQDQLEELKYYGYNI